MVGLTGLLGLSGHLVNTTVINWNTAIILGITVFAGGQIGSRISLKLPEKKVKNALTIVLSAIAFFMIFKTLIMYF